VESNLHSSSRKQHGDSNQTSFPSIRNEVHLSLERTASVVVADLNVGSVLGEIPTPALTWSVHATPSGHWGSVIMDSQVSPRVGYFFVNSQSCHLDTPGEGAGDLQLLQGRPEVGGGGWNEKRKKKN
jgi:hypothetical protein